MANIAAQLQHHDRLTVHDRKLILMAVRDHWQTIHDPSRANLRFLASSSLDYEYKLNEQSLLIGSLTFLNYRDLQSALPFYIHHHRDL